MKIYYSASEAKAQFSQVLKAVRESDTLIVTYRGDPVAEIRPIRKENEAPSPEKLGKHEAYTEELRRRGILRPAYGPKRPFKPVAHIPGALERFLADRG